MAIIFTSPLVISVLSAFFLGERITLKKGLALFIGFDGVVVAVAPWSRAQRIDQLTSHNIVTTSIIGRKP